MIKPSAGGRVHTETAPTSSKWAAASPTVVWASAYRFKIYPVSNPIHSEVLAPHDLRLHLNLRKCLGVR